LAPKFSLTGDISILEGKIRQNNTYRYIEGRLADGKPAMVKDLSRPVGSGAPRQYRGINAQLRWNHRLGETQIRGEYWQGKQSALALSSETPPVSTNEPLYVRRFNGGFFYLLQDIITPKNQLLFKFDWYDPNRMAKGADIGVKESNLGVADTEYDTWGFGLLHHFNEHLKVTLYYDLVRNENTLLQESNSDISEDIFTCRLQFRF
jgi:hypothetical protein